MLRYAALVLTCGCSVVFMHGPQKQRCQLEAPVTDTVIAGLAAAAVSAVVIQDEVATCRSAFDNSCGLGIPGDAVIVVAAAVGLIEGASAIYGWGKRSDCHA